MLLPLSRQVWSSICPLNNPDIYLEYGGLWYFYVFLVLLLCHPWNQNLLFGFSWQISTRRYLDFHGDMKLVFTTLCFVKLSIYVYDHSTYDQRSVATLSRVSTWMSDHLDTPDAFCFDSFLLLHVSHGVLQVVTTVGSFISFIHLCLLRSEVLVLPWRCAMSESPRKPFFIKRRSVCTQVLNLRLRVSSFWGIEAQRRRFVDHMKRLKYKEFGCYSSRLRTTVWPFLEFL